MTNDCLVTKLKGTVNNDVLAKLGEFSLALHGAQNQYLLVNGVENAYSARIVGEAHFTNSAYTEDKGKTAVISRNIPVYVVCTGECIIFVKDENYTVTTIDCYNAYAKSEQILARQLSSIILCLTDGITEEGVLSELTGLSIKDGLIDLKALSGNDSLTSLSLNHNTKAVGDISYLADCVIGGVVNFNEAQGVYGQVANLGKSINATNIVMQSSGIQGSIESLAEEFFANGKTSGQTLFTGNGFLTFNGEVIPNGIGGAINGASGSISITLSGVTGTYNGSTWSYS